MHNENRHRAQDPDGCRRSGRRRHPRLGCYRLGPDARMDIPQAMALLGLAVSQLT